MKILVFNCGSSSLKFALFELHDGSEEVIARGEAEAIGTPEARLTLDGAGGPATKLEPGDHASVVKAVLHQMDTRIDGAPDVIGHRVVHGGPTLSGPTVLNASVLRELEDASRFCGR